MAEQTGIEWTDHTFNPWWGCEKVSPGCAHCYAEGVSSRYEGPGLWGPGHRFRFFGAKHWAEPLKWNRKAERDGVRRRVFCASMADVFEERPELAQYRTGLFNVIYATPQLDWQILTKRPEFARDWLRSFYNDRGIGSWVSRDFSSWGVLPNVWMGVSIENARHTWRADVLREIPAAVRFISAEPLLGSLFTASVAPNHSPAETPEALGGVGEVDVRATEPGAVRHVQRARGHRAPLDLTGIDWVIVGGESGPGARPMRLDWAREIVWACQAESACNPDTGCDCHEVGLRPAIFVKQLGAKPMVPHPKPQRDGDLWQLKLRDRKGGDWTEWPADLRLREFPTSAAVPA